VIYDQPLLSVDLWLQYIYTDGISTLVNQDTSCLTKF